MTSISRPSELNVLDGASIDIAELSEDQAKVAEYMRAAEAVGAKIATRTTHLSEAQGEVAGAQERMNQAQATMLASADSVTRARETVAADRGQVDSARTAQIAALRQYDEAVAARAAIVDRGGLSSRDAAAVERYFFEGRQPGGNTQAEQTLATLSPEAKAWLAENEAEYRRLDGVAEGLNVDLNKAERRLDHAEGCLASSQAALDVRIKEHASNSAAMAAARKDLGEARLEVLNLQKELRGLREEQGEYASAARDWQAELKSDLADWNEEIADESEDIGEDRDEALQQLKDAERRMAQLRARDQKADRFR